ncbi:hypothetical protein [Achromobacter ruhlandii]|uniref:hypothetical protein n=1 Tax=Achromobacter ruhlandii TaxID=72557 RepID=UPI003B9F23FD
MAIKQTITTAYECDVCQQEVPEASVFNGHVETLWSDRDVSATMSVSMHLEISYVTNNGVICNACAAKHMRAVADAIERTAQPAQQGAGE